jgi:hypothetical protein
LAVDGTGILWPPLLIDCVWAFLNFQGGKFTFRCDKFL